MTHQYTKLADELDAVNDVCGSRSIREAARILRAAAAVDVAGLMKLAEAISNAAYASAVDDVNGAGADSTKEVEAEAALESALRMALAAREGFVLVPVEPTPEMVAGFWGEIKHGEPELIAAKQAWREALEAAPKGTP